MAWSDPRPRKNRPLIQGCKLYSKESAAGVTYLSGRLGGLRVLIVPNGAHGAGEHTHSLLFTDATPKLEQEGGA